MTFVYLIVRGSVLLLCSLNSSSGVDFGKCQHGSQRKDPNLLVMAAATESRLQVTGRR